MALHPILNEKLNAAVLADLDLQATRRDAVLPTVFRKVQDREWRALRDAKGDFPRARQRLLTLTFDQLPAMSTKGIAGTTVYDWLLGN
jgi:hypothetical protein